MKVRKAMIGFTLHQSTIELLDTLPKGSRSEFVERLIIEALMKKETKAPEPKLKGVN